MYFQTTLPPYCCNDVQTPWVVPLWYEALWFPPHSRRQQQLSCTLPIQWICGISRISCLVLLGPVQLELPCLQTCNISNGVSILSVFACAESKYVCLHTNTDKIFVQYVQIWTKYWPSFSRKFTPRAVCKLYILICIHIHYKIICTGGLHVSTFCANMCIFVNTIVHMDELVHIQHTKHGSEDKCCSSTNTWRIIGGPWR